MELKMRDKNFCEQDWNSDEFDAMADIFEEEQKVSYEDRPMEELEEEEEENEYRYRIERDAERNAERCAEESIFGSRVGW